MSRPEGMPTVLAVALSRRARVCFVGEVVELPRIGRKLAAFVALLALLMPGVSALAQALSAGDFPACCNTVYCPVHHRQGRNLQKDVSNCAGIVIPGHNDCSMRACDAPPRAAVGTIVFVLVAPLMLRAPLVSESAVAPFEEFAPSNFTIPSTPPPRSSPS